MTTKTPGPATINLHLSMVTQKAPSANYRGENDGSASRLQKLKLNGRDHVVVSADAIRNRLREKLGEADSVVGGNRTAEIDRHATGISLCANLARLAAVFVKELENSLGHCSWPSGWSRFRFRPESGGGSASRALR